VEIIDYIEQRNAPAAQNLYATIVQSAAHAVFVPARSRGWHSGQEYP